MTLRLATGLRRRLAGAVKAIVGTPAEPQVFGGQPPTEASLAKVALERGLSVLEDEAARRELGEVVPMGPREFSGLVHSRCVNLSDLERFGEYPPMPTDRPVGRVLAYGVTLDNQGRPLQLRLTWENRGDVPGLACSAWDTVGVEPRFVQNCAWVPADRMRATLAMYNRTDMVRHYGRWCTPTGKWGQLPEPDDAGTVHGALAYALRRALKWEAERGTASE